MSAASPDAIIHAATLHLLAQAGFASTSQAASVTLTGAAIKYIKWIASTCVEKAALGGRSKVSAGDVIDGLEEVGEGTEELWEWLSDQDGLIFRGGGLSSLSEQLAQGKSEKQIIAEMRMIPESDIPVYEEEDEDDAMDVDEDYQDKKPKPPMYNGKVENDPMDWLPPLPGDVAIGSSSALAASKLVPPQDGEDVRDEEVSPTSNLHKNSNSHITVSQSISDRYRHSIPWSSSQLSSKTWRDPPLPITPIPLPPKTSSFPALLEAYKATATEPSVTLLQTDLRRQATELLRRSIAPSDKWLPKDTLITQIPGPRVSPFVASHPEDPNVQPHLIPINPNPSESGILSALVHQIHSPHLPDALRTRLTALRPPMPQKDVNGNPIFYGPKVRAPDKAARDQAWGKPVDPSTETYLRYTWDSGPKGQDKWGKSKLPTGKKVIASGQGEDVPRQAAPEGNGTNKSRLKIERGLSGSASPAEGSAAGTSTAPNQGVAENNIGDKDHVTSPANPVGSLTRAPSGLTIKLGGRRLSVSQTGSASSALSSEKTGTTPSSDDISPKTIPPARLDTPPSVSGTTSNHSNSVNGAAVSRPGGLKKIQLRISSGDSGDKKTTPTSGTSESVASGDLRPKIRFSTSGLTKN